MKAHRYPFSVLTYNLACFSLSMVLAACGSSFGQPTTTPSITPYPFITATPRPTATPTRPTETPTPIPTVFIPTSTPTPPITRTPTPTLPATPTREAASPGEAGTCQALPLGIFLQIYESDPGLPPSLGCPTSPPDSDEAPRVWVVTVRYQPFERGYMLWLSNLGWFDAKVIYVLLDDLTYTRHDDTFDPNADPSSGNYLPPTGLYEPVDTLGKVWRTSPGLKDRLGFATEPEVMINTKMQMFEYGEMIHIPPTDVVFVFKRGVSNTWSVHDAAGTD